MRKQILQILIDHQGNYISGEEISSYLQVSRTAIWKHIQSLKEEGYEIISSTGKGYSLKGRPDLLTPLEIKTGLKTKIMGQKLFCYTSVGSTNEIAKKKALAGEPEGSIVVAEEQVEGKGRLARWWDSPTSGLWVSLILRPQIDPYQAPHLTFVSAVAVCQALRRFTGLKVMIKWPNDLLYQGKKLCGILTELGAELAVVNYIIIGIGINVNQQVKDWPPEIRAKATSLAAASGKNWRRVDLLQVLLEEYEQVYQLYLMQGFPTILSLWREMNVTLGAEVVVTSREETYAGFAEDIDDYGCLLVRRETGELESLIAEDVSLQKTYNHED